MRAAGTGFVIDRAGLILTNSHVVEEATKIEIDFFGDEEGVYYAAKILGRDRLTDSACSSSSNVRPRNSQSRRSETPARWHPAIGSWPSVTRLDSVTQ